MNIKCPCCGSVNSLDSLIDDEPAAQALMSVLKITAVGRAVVKYLGLFRPAKKSLTWAKTAGLLGELMPMIEAQAIKRNGQDYVVPHHIWESAISKVIEARDAGRLTTPLKSHGYLLEVLVTEVARHGDEKAMAFNAKKQAEKQENDRAVRVAQEAQKQAREAEGKPKERQGLTTEGKALFTQVMAGMKEAIDMTPEDKQAELKALQTGAELPPRIKRQPAKSPEQIKQEMQQLLDESLAQMTDAQRAAFYAQREENRRALHEFDRKLETTH